MNREEAQEIVVKLMTAYPQTRLEPEHVRLFVDEISALGDGIAAALACGEIIRSEQWFPTVAIFRSHYRKVRNDRREPPPEAPPRTEIPIWIHVWWWARHVKDERRDWPQYPSPDWTNVITPEEYAELEAEWREAGELKIENITAVLR